MISTNGTVVHHNVPSPQSHGIPLEEKQFNQSDLNVEICKYFVSFKSNLISFAGFRMICLCPTVSVTVMFRGLQVDLYKYF